LGGAGGVAQVRGSGSTATNGQNGINGSPPG
jgi:hypothetical protein